MANGVPDESCNGMLHVVLGEAGVGRTTVFASLLSIGQSAEIKSALKIAEALRDIAELGLVHRDLKAGNILVPQDASFVLLDASCVELRKGPKASIEAQPSVRWYRGSALPAFSYADNWSTAIPAGAAPTTYTSITRLMSPTDRSWCPSPGPSFAMVNPPSSDRQISHDRRAAVRAIEASFADLGAEVWASTEAINRRDLPSIHLALHSQCDDAEPVIIAPDKPVFSFAMVISKRLLLDLRDDLLRLVVGIRAALCFILMLVLAALSRRPDTTYLILVQLAASRRFGHRGDPDDHALPALTSMSVVIGEALVPSR